MPLSMPIGGRVADLDDTATQGLVMWPFVSGQWLYNGGVRLQGPVVALSRSDDSPPVGTSDDLKRPGPVRRGCRWYGNLDGADKVAVCVFSAPPVTGKPRLKATSQRTTMACIRAKWN
jgi:hypothetical protein